MSGLVVRCGVCGAPDSIAAYRQHRANAEHGTEDLGALVPAEELLETVDREGVELGCVFHFAGQDGGHVFQRAEHAAGDVDPAVDMVFDPGRTAVAVAFGFDPAEEVEEDLAAHAVGEEDGFDAVEADACFDVGFESGEVLNT